MSHHKRVCTRSATIHNLGDDTLERIFQHLPAGHILALVCKRWRDITYNSTSEIEFAGWYRNWILSKNIYTRDEIVEMLKYDCIECIRQNQLNIDDCIYKLDAVSYRHISLIHDYEHVFITILLRRSKNYLESFMLAINTHFNLLATWGLSSAHRDIRRKLRAYAIVVAKWNSDEITMNDQIEAGRIANEINAYDSANNFWRDTQIMRDGHIGLIALLILRKRMPAQCAVTNSLWHHITIYAQENSSRTLMTSLKNMVIYNVNYFIWYSPPEQLLNNIARVMELSKNLYPLAWRLNDALQISLHFNNRQICETLQIVSTTDNVDLFMSLQTALFMRTVQNVDLSQLLEPDGVMGRGLFHRFSTILQRTHLQIYQYEPTYYVRSYNMANYILSNKFAIKPLTPRINAYLKYAIITPNMEKNFVNLLIDKISEYQSI